MTHVDVAIAGGGIVGSSTAYYLRKNGFTGSIAIFEQDTSFKHSCSALSWGGIRQQFSTPENIRLSQFGLALIRNLKQEFGADADIGFKEQGYLVLATERGVPVLEENRALQVSMGADTVIFSGDELAKRFPWINFDGIAAGSFGPRNEGWFDPYSLMTLVRKAAVARDVKLVPQAVTGVKANGMVTGITLANDEEYTVGALVNAAGAGAGALAAMAGIELPVSPAKRYVYVVDCPAAPEEMRKGPLTFDVTGEYFRPEGRNFIWGFTPSEEEEPAVKDWLMDESWFEEKVWPSLAARVPVFEAVKMVGNWVGHYDYNWFDHNGIIGRHPGIPNFYFGNGFSGHGIQQGPATGNAIAELIIHGGFRTIDLTRMGYERLLRKEPLFEKNIF
ncbi:NAD(P)/FAD-dependent oxidoreductase [Aestuariivirga sp.]|uniref:NAD(P)/FAD-dependent oxidoreductase n=1 Tax=Aestuariivirga sp. TaxID=2650926 RepID=UPI0039E51808